MLFVSAAGNDAVVGRGQNIDTFPLFFPASYGLDQMLVVATTDRHNRLTTFTNYGVNSVDIAAPRQSVLQKCSDCQNTSSPACIDQIRSEISEIGN